MNPDVLLAHYDRISEAPDAIPRLRRFILDLAVRGKLVEQDSNDEPASKLVARISMEKRRFKSSVKNDISENVKHSDEAFPLPDTWVWVPATYPASLISDLGKKVHTNDVQEVGAFPVVDQGKAFIRGYCDDEAKVIRVEEPIVLFGDHTREIKLIDFDFVVGADGVKLLQPILLSAEYYFLAIKWLPIESRGYGRHFKLLRSSLIPLPPLAEQHRIVAKVDELMALCDRLEETRTEREQTRNQLVAGCFQRLSQPDEEEVFLEDARFTLNHLSRMTNRPAHIKQLRQAIVNLAIRGKLVEQNPDDEPASVLLRTIQAFRDGLIEKRNIRRDQDVEYSTSMDVDLVPKEWCWVHVADIALVQGGKRLPNGAGFSQDPTPHIYIRVTDMKNGTVLDNNPAYISADVQKQISKYIINKEDLYITIAGTIGQVGKIPAALDGQNLTENAAKIVFRGMDPDFLLLTLTSEAVQTQFTEKTKQMAQPKLALKRICGAHLPLPPLAEQHRIVAKVDELMALCDQLEAQLTNTEFGSRRLLEAVLQEALGVAA